MRVLFDQATPVPIRRFLVGHAVRTAAQQHWDTLQNGDLLTAAEHAGFEVFLTTDQNMQYQQNMAGRTIAVVVIGVQQWLVLPTTQVPPFDVETPYPTEIAGVTLDSYIDWMKSCWYVSAPGNPSASVPAGFTPEGLPIGVQIVGRANSESRTASRTTQGRASWRSSWICPRMVSCVGSSAPSSSSSWMAP